MARMTPPHAPREAGRTGVQTVGRAIELLRLAAEAGNGGLSLRQATLLSGWGKSTVHRLLKELAAGGLLFQAPGKVYLLGRFAHELGLAPSPLTELRELCAGALQRIAQDTHATVFLGLRSGTSSVSLDYVIGGEVRPPVVPPRGTLRPLGVGAAGLAVLSRLHDREVEDINARNQRRMIAYGERGGESLLRRIERTRADGYARVANIVASGVVGIGACIADPVGTPLCSISVVATVSRMTAAAERSTVRSVFDEIRVLRPLLLQNARLAGLLRS